MQSPKETLNELSLGVPKDFNELRVIPILRTAGMGSVLTDIEEAIQAGWLEVTEVSETGQVPELGVVNHSDMTIIAFDGEELIGAKQNRILNVTVIIAGHTKMVIPVSCVEQGRWSWHSRRFSAGEFMYPSLRREKFQRVTENLRASRAPSADQGMIWDQIEAKSARMGVRSETGSMKDLSDRYYVDDKSLQEHFPHEKEQVGYLAFVRDGFAGGDIFPSPSISTRKFYKLLRSYYLDSLDSEVKFPQVPSTEILDQIKSSLMEPEKSVGSGEEIRFEGAKVQGSLTFFQEELAHLTVFPKVGQRERFRREGRYWVD